MDRRSFLRSFWASLAALPALPALPSLLSAGRRPSPPSPGASDIAEVTHVKRRLVGEVEISQEAMDRFRGGAAEFADLLKEHYQLGIVAQFDDQVPMQGLFEEPKGRRAEFRL